MPSCSQRARPRSASKCHGGSARAGAAVRSATRSRAVVRRQQFGRARGARAQRRARARRTSAQRERTARRDRARRGRCGRARPAHRQQQVSLSRVEQCGVGERARRDDAHDLALDRALRLRDVADLLADRDRLAELHELAQIAGRPRDTARRPSGSARRPIAPRAVSVMSSSARARSRVVEEELVEVAHPVEERGCPDARP